MRLARTTPGLHGLVDLDRMLLVTLGKGSEVSGRDTGEACGFADRKLVNDGTSGTDLVGIDTALPGGLAGRQVGFGDPPRPVRVGNRN